MRWKGRRQSSNIEDVRGRASRSGRIGRMGRSLGRGGRLRLPGGRRIGRRGGGMSFKTLAFLVVVGVVLQVMGVDVLGLLTGQGRNTSTSSNSSYTSSAQDEETKAFVATVLAETEDVWHGIFQASGQTYEEPKLVLFSGSWRSACGAASAATGPFYCPSDHKIYLDMDFFNEMATRFQASGDFAQAYVVAHEVGHHVQNLTGVLPKFNQARRTMSASEANAMSVRVELQADCLAGIWAKYTDQQGLLETGDLEEALNAAHQIGDDELQKQAQGYVMPDSFTHGTSAQRMKWFQRGFDTGRYADCDTFSGDV